MTLTSDESMRDVIDRAADMLIGAEHAIALTGAGLSVESGIPSFRGPGGLWTRYGQPSNLSYRVFSRDPQAWWESRLRDEVAPGNPTYDLKAAVDNARPNAGHIALADLESAGVLKSVITQNVDGLHSRAGSSRGAGDTREPQLSPVHWLWGTTTARRLPDHRFAAHLPGMWRRDQAGHRDVRRAHSPVNVGRMY